MSAVPLIDVRGITKQFPLRRGIVERLRGGRPPAIHALREVDFSVSRGETFALVGESGCGKSTLARIVMGLIPPTGGSVAFDGQPVENLSSGDTLRLRRRIQMVFQNPFGSLNPRMRVGQIVGEPLHVHRAGLSLGRSGLHARVAEVLRDCGLDPTTAERFPHQFSGGQRQRIAIARALALKPECLVLDEPVSALDVSIQAQIVNLLAEQQRQRGLTYLFISHDLSLVRCFADRVAVMYFGRICELGPVDAVLDRPRHHYTSGLLRAVPDIKARTKRRAIVGGELPNPVDPPPGCTFHTRCPAATERCRSEVPPLTAAPDGRLLACHHPLA
jgi:oligopeptide/dipeptide ABC transporter ATP-binding protein